MFYTNRYDLINKYSSPLFLQYAILIHMTLCIPTCRILQPSNYKSSGMGSKLSAMGVSGVGNRLVGGGMSGHRNSISFDRSGEYCRQLNRKLPVRGNKRDRQ